MSVMRTILVCGGRHYRDWATLSRVLHHETARGGPCAIIHGAATGADSMAAQWAYEAGVPATAFPADWAAHGKAAGSIRNQQMLDTGKPSLVVAFPGGRGTADMVRRARAAGIEVHEVEP